VRPTGFFSAITAAFLPMARRGRMFDMGAGHARTNPISEHDLADIVADVGLGGDGPRDVAAGGPEVMTRREMLERIAAAVHKPVAITGLPIWLMRGSAAILRGLHPRMGQFMQFIIEIAQRDLIAPALGSTRLADYVDSLDVVGRCTAA
jgi:uncharacterized protein YbjT (DUF2867 family)